MLAYTTDHPPKAGIGVVYQVKKQVTWLETLNYSFKLLQIYAFSSDTTKDFLRKKNLLLY